MNTGIMNGALTLESFVVSFVGNEIDKARDKGIGKNE